jgi:hypothetical protein
MATTVRNVNGTVAGYPMSGPKWGIIERMGNTFYNTRHAAPLNALNDRKIEVALLHTNALMSTKYNQFSILVIAQAIQDMLEPPSDPGGNAFDHTDDNGNEAGYGYYDTAAVIANHVPALPVQIPDRILAEQKIMARVVRNGLDAGLEQNFTDLRSSRAFTFLGKYPANGHRYYLSTSAVTWLEAQRICETNGGYLVTLGDANERNWLKAQVDPLLDATVPAEAFYWIGLYRVRTPATTSEYAWVTAEPFCPGNATYYPPGPHPAPFWAAVPGGNTTSGVGAQETVVKADSTHSQATATEYYIGGATNTPVEWRFVMECEPSVTVDRYEFIEE